MNTKRVAQLYGTSIDEVEREVEDFLTAIAGDSRYARVISVSFVPFREGSGYVAFVVSELNEE